MSILDRFRLDGKLALVTGLDYVAGDVLPIDSGWLSR